jgi:peptidyl-prolyl cis-trans isomerase C
MLSLRPLRDPSAPPLRTRTATSLTLFLMLALTLGAASAQGGDSPGAPATAGAADPVLVQLGSTRERASFVLERFEIAVRGVASSQGVAYGAELFEQLYGFLPTFLDQRATELVLIAQARARGIVVEDAEIDVIIERVRANAGGDDAAFALLLAEAGFSGEAQLRVLVRETELVQRALAAIRGGIVVTADEVTIAYAAQRLRFTAPAEACSRHILVTDEERAVEMRAELEAGADFGELARAESIDPGSAARGGELGCLRQGLTVPEFDTALFGSEVGAFVGPVGTQFGYHLIQVYEVRPARVRALAEVRAELEQELRQQRAEAVLSAIIDASGVQVFPQFIPPLEESVDEAAGA